jgi:hypothetical protein
MLPLRTIEGTDSQIHLTNDSPGWDSKYYTILTFDTSEQLACIVVASRVEGLVAVYLTPLTIAIAASFAEFHKLRVLRCRCQFGRNSHQIVCPLATR